MGKIGPLDIMDNAQRCIGIWYADALTCLNHIQAIYKSWTGGATSSAPNFTPIDTSCSDPGEGKD